MPWLFRSIISAWFQKGFLSNQFRSARGPDCTQVTFLWKDSLLCKKTCILRASRQNAFTRRPAKAQTRPNVHGTGYKTLLFTAEDLSKYSSLDSVFFSKAKKKNCYTRALLCAARQRAKHVPTMRHLEKLFQLDSKTIVLDLSAPQSGA